MQFTVQQSPRMSKPQHQRSVETNQINIVTRGGLIGKDRRTETDDQFELSS